MKKSESLAIDDGEDIDSVNVDLADKEKRKIRNIQEILHYKREKLNFEKSHGRRKKVVKNEKE